MSSLKELQEKHLYYDSILQPKDKLNLHKDEILMSEFEPDGRPHDNYRENTLFR